MNDDDIHAFTPPAAAPAPAPVRRRRWPWVLVALGALAALFFVLMALALAGALSEIGELRTGGVTVTVDGETLELPPLHGGHIVTLIGAVAVALVVALVVVPLVLLAVFGVAGLAVVGALIAVLAVVALAASPVLLGLALIWWLLRSARKAPTAADPSSSA